MLYFFVPFILFFLDICVQGLIHAPVLHSLHAFTLAHSLNPEKNGLLAFCLFLLSLQSILQYEQAQVILIYTIPLLLLGRMIKHLFFSDQITLILITLCAVILQTQILPPIFLKPASSLLCTVGQITGTLIVVLFFSLK